MYSGVQRTRVELAGSVAVAAARSSSCPVQPGQDMDVGDPAAAAHHRCVMAIVSAGALEGAHVAGDTAAMAGGEGSTPATPSPSASPLSSTPAMGGGAALCGLGGGSTPPSPPPMANLVGTAAATAPSGSGLVDLTPARQKGKVAPAGPGVATPSRRSLRHGVGPGGAAASDEDSLAKAMRLKAATNLDFAG
jgi:hypothetical protein